MMNDEDHTPCGNLNCNVRSACARSTDYADEFLEEPEKWVIYNLGDSDGENCEAFIVRQALGGQGNTDVVFAEARRGKGRIHNAHAGPRTDYPGTRELFGHIFGKGSKVSPNRGKKVSNPQLPKRPDLMVSRHIAKGRNIKKEGDGPNE